MYYEKQFQILLRWPDSVVSLVPLCRATNINIGSIPGCIRLAQRPRCDLAGGPIKASKLSQHNDGFVLIIK